MGTTRNKAWWQNTDYRISTACGRAQATAARTHLNASATRTRPSLRFGPRFAEVVSIRFARANAGRRAGSDASPWFAQVVSNLLTLHAETRKAFYLLLADLTMGHL